MLLFVVDPKTERNELSMKKKITYILVALAVVGTFFTMSLQAEEPSSNFEPVTKTDTIFVNIWR